jgi:hypothetical protein
MKLLVYFFGLLLAFSSCSSSKNAVARLQLEGEPTAKTVMSVTGSTLTANSTISWQIGTSKEGPWKTLPGIQSKEIVLLTDYANKFLRCEVVSTQNGQTKTASVTTTTPVQLKGNPNTDWFKDAGLGLMVHYLKVVYSPEGGSNEWNQAVNSFDAERFAADCEQAGVNYVMFALGQNDGYYCSPNAAYDSIVGIAPGVLCSKRDLPMDLINSLEKRGIKMLFYLPGNPAHSNKISVPKFQYSYGKDTPTSQYTQERLEAVIREWSLRYGSKLWGWWFDGMYRSGIIQTRSDMSLRYNISTHTLAAKAGNPRSIVTYNYGVNKIQTNSPYDDYSAGEENHIVQLPTGRWVEEGVQWFHFTHLGSTWAKPGTQFQTADLTSWAEKVFQKEGVLCFDVHVKGSGAIDPEQIAQLKAVSTVFKKVKKH